MSCDQVTLIQNNPTVTVGANTPVVSSNQNNAIVSATQNIPLINESQINYLVPINCFANLPIVQTGYLLYEDGISKIILEDSSGFLKLEN